jgi:hypothetical protein
MDDQQTRTPWMNLREAGTYCKRGPRFLAREIKAGRLRAAIVGGRKEVITRPEWLDEWVESLSRPAIGFRRGTPR